MNEIKMRRQKKGLSQQELADKLSVSRTAVTLWELGINKPRAEHLIQMSRIFRCSVDKLLCPRR